MEDGVKGDTAKPEKAKFIGKEGWVKKCSGKFLGSYKDRYIQVEKTEIVVYEREDLKNCLERVDLENYEECREFRSAFKLKKTRLILIRAQKCGNTIHDIKIQAQNPEEKDAWIKALTDGIDRAKNKILDLVKVDESCSLEHVTRTRPKGNQGRRPPTRIVMKEAATTSSDGTSREDFDVPDSTRNGTHLVNTEVDTANEAVKPPMPPSQPSKSHQEIPEEEPTAQKKVLKPPMPPSKENKPISSIEGETQNEEEPAPPIPPSQPSESQQEIQEEEPTPQKKVLKPPMPPSKENKPSSSSDGETPNEEEPAPSVPPSQPSESPQEIPEEEPTPQKKVLKPPMPPSKENKPSSSSDGETPNEEEPATSVPPSQPSESPQEIPEEEPTPQKKVLKPPMPPSKENKPSSSSDGETPNEEEPAPSVPPSQPSESPQEIPEEEPTPQKKVLKPPMPPSEENKPSFSGEGETPNEEEPAPPMTHSKASNPSEDSDSTHITPPPSPPLIGDPSHLPIPSSKGKKPVQTVEWESPQLSCGAEDSQEESPEETFPDRQGKTDKLGSEGDSTPLPQRAVKPPEAKLDSTAPEKANESSDEKEKPCPTREEPDHNNAALEAGGNSASAIMLNADTQRPATPLTKSPRPSPRPGKKTSGPPAPPKKKPLNLSKVNQPCHHREGLAEVTISVESMGADTVSASGISDLSKHTYDLTLTAEHDNKEVNQSTEDTVDIVVFPDQAVQISKEEEPSNSSQHPHGELHHGDSSKAEAEPAEGCVPWMKVEMLKEVQTKLRLKPTPFPKPRKPSKGKSASVGDLLSESVVQVEEWAPTEISRTSPRNDMNELHNKVTLALEDTDELLSIVSSRQEVQGSLGDNGGVKVLSPGELLAKAEDRLRKADLILREAMNLKQAQPVEKRRSL